MNPRIEKKLSKRLVRLCPSIYGKAWIDSDHSEFSCEENSNVRHCPSVGGGFDSYTGDSDEVYTAWASWLACWPWRGDFPEYPHSHDLAMYPNTEGFKPTTRNLLKLAARYEAFNK